MTLLYFFDMKRRCEPKSFFKAPTGGGGGRTSTVYADMPIMNIQISLKFHAVCATSIVMQNYNDLGLKELFNTLRILVVIVLAGITVHNHQFIIKNHNCAMVCSVLFIL